MKITWTNRYSDTDQPDRHGRWARLAWWNNYCIGFINRLQRKYGEKMLFEMHLSIPDKWNTFSTGVSSIHNSFREAKKALEDQFDFFCDEVKNNQ